MAFKKFAGVRRGLFSAWCASFVLLAVGCVTGSNPDGDGAEAGDWVLEKGDRAEDVRGASLPIVGGTTTTGFESTVLLLTGSGKWWDVLCSGTLIGPRTVLTAAHCTDAIAGGLRVYFGSNFRDAADPAFLGVVEVSGFAPHPNWNPSTLKNDIAILALKEDAPVAPSPILASPLNKGFIGETLTLVGFGNTSGTQSNAGRKRVTTTALDSITATTLAWQDPKRNTCHGDSGGPAFLEFDTVSVLAGVTSYGDEWCLSFGVDTRVDAYVDSFIVPIMATYGDTPLLFDANEGEVVNLPAGDAPSAVPDQPATGASCEGFCGTKAPSGCWCDTQCANYGDCCADRADAC